VIRSASARWCSATFDGRPILTSETCALDMIGAKYVRDIEPWRNHRVRRGRRDSHKPFPPAADGHCIFEYIYFLAPDSIVGGRSVYDVRKAFGAQLARESHVEVDVVCRCRIPACPRARLQQHSGCAVRTRIIRNHYVAAPSSSRRRACANSACA